MKRKKKPLTLEEEMTLKRMNDPYNKICTNDHDDNGRVVPAEVPDNLGSDDWDDED